LSRQFFPYGKQSIDEDDIQSVVDVLKSDYLTTGPKIEEFETKLAEYCGAKYAVVFNSGTSALHSAFFTAGLKRGDEFITSPMTFAATANAGLYLGASPVFTDIEDDTGNIDVNLIEHNITEKTKLIVPVHYGGHTCEMDDVKKIADKYNVKIVEDACHALGGAYKSLGSVYNTGSCHFSDMSVLSFHPVKHITTGEGGAVLTNNRHYYETLKMFGSHGITKNPLRFVNADDTIIKNCPWYHEMQFLGYNYRMTDIQAALGISQLKKNDLFVKRRREIAKMYKEHFKNNPFFLIPAEKDYAYHAYHLFPIRFRKEFINKKTIIYNKLKDMGIGTQVHYIPAYHHPYYQQLGYKKGICPVAEQFYSSELSIPMYPGLTDADIHYIITTLFDILESL